MYLKRLELTGFKSFADRTELEFVRGITAVVGPNGSGKSNISDGIRWVLGEQSARSLRGGNMQDVIFAGSDSRKAVNFGEVTLTLDNLDGALALDYNEVSVTRRIHRSGESEYFINKQSCRLKDITELFMDTGIGKEAYSIIGQGRIEEILSTRSEDRRGIFEEASGIVKYKSRKKEAEKKLADTETNLLRIHDLISELEDQVEPLREQSEKAIQYKALKDKLKSAEISLYVYQIEQLHITWSEAGKKLELLQRVQLELSTVVSKHDAHLELHRAATRGLEEELELLQAQLLLFSEEFEKCEGQGELLKERKRFLEMNQMELAGQMEQLRRRQMDKHAELQGLTQKFTAINQQHQTLLQQLQDEEFRLLGVAGGSSSAEEERLKSEMIELLNRSAGTRNDVRFAEQQLEVLHRRVSRLDEERQKWSEQRDKLAARKNLLLDRITFIERELAAIKNKLADITDDFKTKQSLLDEAQLTARRWEQKLDALRTRRDTMQELQNDYDGFQHGVREILKSKDRPDGLKGIHGAVAELLKVPVEVELAVETALGGALQNIVVESEAFGRDAISFLKRKQLGRATLLPLDVMKSRSIPESEQRTIRGNPGCVGLAVDLIQYEPQYRNIFGNLLGNVVIAQSLEQANRIAAACHYRYRVVTLEGDVVHPGGSMTGGSVNKKTTSLIGRNRQLEELQQEIAASEQQWSSLAEKAAQIKLELEQAAVEQESYRLRGETFRLEQGQLIAECGQLEHEERNILEQLALYIQDGEVMVSELADLQERKTTAEARLIELKQEEVAVQEAMRLAELARKAKESAKEELQEQLTELKVKSASLGQEKQSLREQINRMQLEQTEWMQELQTNQSKLDSLLTDIVKNEHASVEQIELLNHCSLKKMSCSEAIDFKRADRVEWLRKLETEENHTREQRQQLKKTEDELHQTEVKAARMDVELDNLLKKLAEEYELSFELAKSRYSILQQIQETQDMVREHKRMIAALGEVNIGAIDEYSRVFERFHFLSSQREDLAAAKSTIYGIIQDMNEEMSKRFHHTFELIRGQFVGVFAKLFAGGRADLVLTDPANALETGIEIVAQPPGKKLQNLQLLSGGERALTAIALLFAILHVKPVPFCVLDEVEAALDEANVTRFAEYLREFSQETQFIVVTHRKGTMEEADVLYGVAMEEGGVSKLVSVRLEDEEAISA